MNGLDRSHLGQPGRDDNEQREQGKKGSRVGKFVSDQFDQV